MNPTPISLIAILAAASLINADEIVKLSNGTAIKIRDDKTWDYVEQKETIPAAKAEEKLDTARFNELIGVKTDKFEGTNDFFEKRKLVANGITFGPVYYSTKKGITGTMRFVSKSDGWRFLDYHPLVALCDGVKIEFDEPSHDGSVGNGYVLEFMYADIPSIGLQKIGNCKEFEMRLGIQEIKITYEQRESWRLLGQMFDKKVSIKP